MSVAVYCYNPNSCMFQETVLLTSSCNLKCPGIWGFWFLIAFIQLLHLILNWILSCRIRCLIIGIHITMRSYVCPLKDTTGSSIKCDFNFSMSEPMLWLLCVLGLDRFLCWNAYSVDTCFSLRSLSWLISGCTLLRHIVLNILLCLESQDRW